MGTRAKFPLALLAAVLVIDAQELRFREYGRNDGFPGGHVYAARQEQAGWLWVAGGQGLFRFDGHSFERWGATMGIPAGAVHAVEETTDRRLWAVSPQGIFVRHPDRTKFERVDVPVAEHLRSAAAAHGPRLFVADQKTLWILNVPASGSPQIRSVAAPPGATPLGQAAVDAQGVVWVICGRHLCRLDSAAQKLTPVGLDLPSESWLTLAAGPRGELALRAPKALWLREAGAGVFRPAGAALGAATLEGAALAFTPEGELLASTVSGVSVGRLRDGLRQWQAVGSQNGLRSPFVTAISLDREGAAWLCQGSEPSVVRWDRRAQWEHWGRGQGLDDQVVWGVTRDAQGTLWAASHSGLYRKSEQRFTALRPDGQEYYAHPAAAPDGSLWVLVNRDRVRRIAGAALQDFPVPGARLRFLLLDRQRRLWALGDRLYRTAGDVTQGGVRFLPIQPPGGVGAGELFSQATLDAAGRVLITSTGGLVIYDPAADTWERLGVDAGLASLRLQAVLADSSGRVWVSYRQPSAPGRLHFVNGHWQADHLSVPKELETATVVSFAEDREKRIWVGTESGIFVWNGTAWRRYGLDDGLSSEDFTAGGLHADPDGSLWASTGRGLSRFADDRPALAPLPLPGGAIVDLDLHGQTAEFSLRSLAFWRSSDQLFLYRLQGRRFYGSVFDSGWLEARDPDVRHDNLPGGSYAVELKTRNSEEAWSATTVRQEFQVPVPWYGSAWFLVAALVGLPVAVYWWWRSRRSLQLRRETWDRERLTREVDLRTQALTEARLREEESNRRKSELLAGLGEQIRRPLHGLNGLVELALSSAKDEQQRQYLESAQESAASVLALVGDLLDYAETERGQVALRQEPCDLRDCVRGVTLTLQSSPRASGRPVGGEVSAKVPAVLIGDRQRLRQVLLHIASHVLRQQGVSIVVELEYTSADAAVLIFGVYDPAARPGLFSTLDPDEVAGRDGLGLAIAARMIELMGGRLTACGSAGHRSFRFSLRLPVAAGPQAAGLLRVLLAEDDVQSRRVTAALLEQVGFSVTTLAGREDALEQAGTHDVLVIDPQFPEALSLARRLRTAEAAGTQPPIRIVGLTASDDVAGRERAEAAGFDAVLTKPARLEDLLPAIRDVASTGPRT